MAKKKISLPELGAAFAFPIGDGRWSVCRVLQRDGGRTEGIVVASSAWIGAGVPDAGDPALRPFLCPTHHAWTGEPNMLWISEPPPADFQPIGNIPPTQAEQDMVCRTYGAWHLLAMQPLMQWRWDHDRAAVLAEDAAKAQANNSNRAAAEKQRRLYLKRVTLDALRTHRFFEHWTKYPDPKLVEASRKIMAGAVEELRLLGPNASKKERLAALQGCIEAFNALDAQSGFIETVEREDICHEFEALVHACGLGSRKNLADKWRTW